MVVENALYRIMDNCSKGGQSRDENKKWIELHYQILRKDLFNSLELPFDSIPMDEAIYTFLNIFWKEPNDIEFWLREVSI